MNAESTGGIVQGQAGGAIAACKSGDILLNGGCAAQKNTSNEPLVTITFFAQSQASPYTPSWTCEGFNTSGQTAYVFAYATCLSVP